FVFAGFYLLHLKENCNMENQKLINNEDAQRFELKSEGQTAFIEYQQTDATTIMLTHTKVPAELEGRGVGKKLVELTLHHLRDHNLKADPKCAFVSVYLKRHPEWNAIVVK